ncbi:MAG: T9SS type A sorting domain-containing protein, partial [candidate division Zixibacteria bacterium]|nr:T9SS type A sorting domain-containing protein [candidate division Zixibacteria bacterium]
IPDDNGGLQLYDLDRIETEMAQPRQAYSAFGAIQAVGTLGSSVVIAQRDRAVTAIALDPTGAPQSPTAVLPGVRNATRLVGVGDRLLGLYPDQRMVAVIRDAGGMFELDTAVEDISAVIHDVRMSDARLDSLRLLFLLGDQFVDVYSVTPHWRLEHSMRLLFPARPTDAALTDSILVIGTDRRLFVYVIRPDLSTEYRATIELGVSAFDPEELVAIVPTEKSNLLLVVTSRSVRSLDLSKPSLPIMTDSVNLPYGLTAAARTGDHLWVMSVDRGLLRVLADGSNPLALEDSMSASGSMIAAVGDLVAVANSHGAHLYDRRTPTWAGEDGGPALPTEITLQQNYPNPFNPETTIEFEIPAPMAVRLEVFNVLGQSVGELIDGMLPSGRHQARFDASRVSSGVYFYRISAGAESRTRKMVVIK